MELRSRTDPGILLGAGLPGLLNELAQSLVSKDLGFILCGLRFLHVLRTLVFMPMQRFGVCLRRIWIIDCRYCR